MADSHQLVIVGGGVAGLDIATHLAKSKAGNRDLIVTLIDRETAYVWKPMLHIVAAGTSDAGAQETVYAAQAHSRGFIFQPGEVTSIDRTLKRVTIAPLKAGDEEIVPERSIDYDTLVLAVGSRANDFGTQGVVEHCRTIDTRGDAIAFNNLLRMRMIKAAVDGKPLTVGIVGGGATGVELAAELVQTAEIAEQFGIVGAFRRLEIVLIESANRILAPFPDRVAEAAAAKLEQLGITLRTSARVARVDQNDFVLQDGERISAELKVWAAGVKAPPLLDRIDGLERSRNGQLVVGPTLQAASDPHVLAVGDCASPQLPGQERPVPSTAQAAHQHALYLCRYLPRLIAGEHVPAATYHDFGSLVSLGGYDAYGSLGRFGLIGGGFLQGRVAQLGHAMLYRSYQARLHGFWRGGLLWLADILARHVRSAGRLA